MTIRDDNSTPTGNLEGKKKDFLLPSIFSFSLFYLLCELHSDQTKPSSAHPHPQLFGKKKERESERLNVVSYVSQSINQSVSQNPKN